MDNYRDITHTDISDVRETILHFNNIKLRNAESPAFLQHDILAPFAFVYEKFDTTGRTGEVEYVDCTSYHREYLTRNEYQYVLDRPLHTHGSLEIMIVLSGSVRNYIEEESFIYRPGQGCIMNSHIRHREVPETDCEIMFITVGNKLLNELLIAMQEERSAFRGNTLKSFIKDALDIPGDRKLHKHYLEFSPSSAESRNRSQNLLCSDTVNALRSRRPGCIFLAKAAILGFLSDLSDARLYTLQSVSSALSHQDFIVSKIELMIRTSHGRVSKPDLEEQLSYNGDYLNRLYKQRKGQSISDACRDIMVSDARHLLESTDLSIDNIIQLMGVSSRGYFFSQFRQYTGMTPREYRTNYLAQGEK